MKDNSSEKGGSIKDRGFTMVELMIVIAIIAVLASIIMPKMTGARNRSTIAACKGNLRQIATAMEMYANENNGNYIPTSYSLPANFCFSNSCYLVSAGYMKSGPKCPYLSPLRSNQPYYWLVWYGGGNFTSNMIYCATDSIAVPHPGLSGLNYPCYRFGKGVVEK